MFGFLNNLPSLAPMIGGPLTAPGLAPMISRGVSQFMGGIAGPQTGDAVTAESASGHASAAQPTSFMGRLGQGIGDLGRGLSQEGLGGLLDFGGMMDRQQAQRDLSGRFQVLPDDFVGPRRANQVSQEEYQNIARTFSSVRRGTGELPIDASRFDGANAATDAADYRQGSLDMIANMMMTTSGRQQINNLNNNVAMNDDGTQRTDDKGNPIHRHTTIMPLFADGTTAGNFNAGALRSDNGFAAPVDGSKMSRNADGTRGEGTDVNIKWNPGANNIGGDGARSDIILAHEMEHAIHESQGTMATGKYGTNPDGSPRVDSRTNNFERQAVGLSRSDSPGGGHYPGDPDGCTENTYRAERNALGLGERWLPRESYSHLPGQAGNAGDLTTAWERHRTSGNAR